MAWRDIFVSTTGDAGNTGLTEGSPWTIEKAMTTCVAEDYVWVKADGTYTLSATLAPAGSGTIANNKKIVFKGYNTTPGDASAGNFVGDMDYGQNYYQGVYDFYLNGYVAGKSIDIDADGGSYVALTLDSAENVDFHHFYIHNTDKITPRNCVSIGMVGVCASNHFYNCKFDDAFKGIYIDGISDDLLYLFLPGFPDALNRTFFAFQVLFHLGKSLDNGFNLHTESRTG